MADRARSGSSYGFCGEPKQSTGEELLGTKKTVLVLVVVVGCFAVLWPKLFYPMLVANANKQIQPSDVDKAAGCCDVIYETDIDTIRIMSELCGTITDAGKEDPPNHERLVAECRKAVLETCGIDISAVLQERVSLGQSVKQILEEVRSLNGSLCLKYNFGVSPWSLGVPHRVTIRVDPAASIRQERPVHFRPEMMHPAFRERGRAIPQPEASAGVRRPGPSPRIIEGRPGPIPGMRPAMGGSGHVVQSKHQNNGIMGLLMPIYTIGFAIFFAYTIMKLAFKKKTELYPGATLYPPCETDDDFRKEVFDSSHGYYMQPRSVNNSSKIVVNAVSALLEEMDQEIQAHKNHTKATLNEQDEVKANGSALPDVQEEDQGSVTIMAMETTASCEGGKRWSRPESPVVPRPSAVQEPLPPPQQIFLEGVLPAQSQILVADSATETQSTTEEDPAVVLAGKMTLSVISLDSEAGTEDSSNSGRKRDSGSEEGRRTSSSNASEEFEKIDAAQLEDQIDNIIEEAMGRFDIDRIEEKSESAKQRSVIEEIRHQLSLEDDLLEALRGEDDVIQDFLVNENVHQNVEDEAVERQILDALDEEVRQITQKEDIRDVMSEQTLQELQAELDNITKPEETAVTTKTAEVQDTEVEDQVKEVRILESREETATQLEEKPSTFENHKIKHKAKGVKFEDTPTHLEAKEEPLEEKVANLEVKLEEQITGEQTQNLPPVETQQIKEKATPLEDKHEELLKEKPQEVKSASIKEELDELQLEQKIANLETKPEETSIEDLDSQEAEDKTKVIENTITHLEGKSENQFLKEKPQSAESLFSKEEQAELQSEEKTENLEAKLEEPLIEIKEKATMLENIEAHSESVSTKDKTEHLELELEEPQLEDQKENKLQTQEIKDKLEEVIAQLEEPLLMPQEIDNVSLIKEEPDRLLLEEKIAQIEAKFKESLLEEQKRVGETISTLEDPETKVLKLDEIKSKMNENITNLEPLIEKQQQTITAVEIQKAEDVTTNLEDKSEETHILEEKITHTEGSLQDPLFKEQKQDDTIILDDQVIEGQGLEDKAEKSDQEEKASEDINKEPEETKLERETATPDKKQQDISNELENKAEENGKCTFEDEHNIGEQEVVFQIAEELKTEEIEPKLDQGEPEQQNIELVPSNGEETEPPTRNQVVEEIAEVKDESQTRMKVEDIIKGVESSQLESDNAPQEQQARGDNQPISFEELESIRRDLEVLSGKLEKSKEEKTDGKEISSEKTDDTKSEDRTSADFKDVMEEEQIIDEVDLREKYRLELGEEYDSDVEHVVDDVEYLDQSDEELDEDMDLGVGVADRLNGDTEGSKNGVGDSETAAENDISDEELDDDNEDDDEEIEEIIEYVDNTDEEGEEIVELNQNRRLNHNGTHGH